MQLQKSFDLINVCCIFDESASEKGHMSQHSLVTMVYESTLFPSSALYILKSHCNFKSRVDVFHMHQKNSFPEDYYQRLSPSWGAVLKTHTNTNKNRDDASIRQTLCGIFTAVGFYTNSQFSIMDSNKGLMVQESKCMPMK